MTDKRYLWVFCYDISDAALRRRVADTLLDRAVRVQDSVYEGRMNRRAARALAADILALLLPGDSFRAYRLSEAGRRASLRLGGPPIAESGDFWLL